jgi:hypothetical protein
MRHTFTGHLWQARPFSCALDEAYGPHRTAFKTGDNGLRQAMKAKSISAFGTGHSRAVPAETKVLFEKTSDCSAGIWLLKSQDQNLGNLLFRQTRAFGQATRQVFDSQLNLASVCFGEFGVCPQNSLLFCYHDASQRPFLSTRSNGGDTHECVEREISGGE